MFVRPVTFVDYIEIPNVKVEYSSNLCLHDIDDDGDIELLVGQWDQQDVNKLNPELIDSDPDSMNGRITVIKYDSILCDAPVNGIITCISAGNIMRNSKPNIVVLCANSRCFCFSLETNDGTDGNFKEGSNTFLKLDHSQLFPPNSKCALIGDVDGDGIDEMVVACSDRSIRMFRFTLNEVSDNESADKSVSGQGFFMELLRWDLPGLVGSISFHPLSFKSKDNDAKGMQILASQPGGNAVILQWTTESVDKQPTTWYRYIGEECGNDGGRNSDMRTEVVGNIRRSADNGSVEPYVAICTAEGELILMEGEERIWQLRLGHGELFGLCKIDITKDEAQEVVACSWDGSIYIIGHQRGIARFQRGPSSAPPQPSPSLINSSSYTHNANSSQAFLAGLYTLAPDIPPQPVFIYACFRSGIQLYHSLHLNKISAHNLLQELSPALKTKIRACGIDVNDNEQLRRFISGLLYATTDVSKSNSINIRGKNDGCDFSEPSLSFYQPDPNYVHSPLFKNKSYL